MRIIRWKRSNSVFFSSLDTEHQTIFQATGALQQALHTGASLVQVQESLRRLMECTEEHFAHEERLMRAAHYLSFDWHRQQHDTVRKRLRRFAPFIEQGDRDTGQELVEFLTHWLDEHTTVTDRMMAAYLRNQERVQIR